MQRGMPEKGAGNTRLSLNGKMKVRTKKHSARREARRKVRRNVSAPTAVLPETRNHGHQNRTAQEKSSPLRSETGERTGAVREKPGLKRGLNLLRPEKEIRFQSSGLQRDGKKPAAFVLLLAKKKAYYSVASLHRTRENPNRSFLSPKKKKSFSKIKGPASLPLTGRTATALSSPTEGSRMPSVQPGKRPYGTCRLQGPKSSGPLRRGEGKNHGTSIKGVLRKRETNMDQLPFHILSKKNQQATEPAWPS